MMIREIDIVRKVCTEEIKPKNDHASNKRPSVSYIKKKEKKRNKAEVMPRPGEMDQRTNIKERVL